MKFAKYKNGRKNARTSTSTGLINEIEREKIDGVWLNGVELRRRRPQTWEMEKKNTAQTWEMEKKENGEEKKKKKNGEKNDDKDREERRGEERPQWKTWEMKWRWSELWSEKWNLGFHFFLIIN